MITGDHPSTAIAVAKDVGMARPQAEVLLIDAAPLVKAHPGQLLAAGPSVGHHEPIVSMPSVKARVRFDFDDGQDGVDEGRAPAAPADDERQAPVALGSEGQTPGALADERQAPAALADEIQASAALVEAGLSPAALNERRALAATIDKGHGPVALSSVQQAPEALVPSLLDGFPAAPMGFSPPPIQGLSLVGHADQHSYSVAQAMTALAEGQLQCVVTGSALDYLLQHAPASMMETVMRSAVVFARMRPHQKGQAMALLGSAGLRRAFQGRSCHLAVSLLPCTCTSHTCMKSLDAYLETCNTICAGTSNLHVAMLCL